MASSQDSGERKQSETPSSAADEPTVVLGAGGALSSPSVLTPPEGIPVPPPIPTPVLDNEGALVTHLGQPESAAQVAGVARAAQARARQDVASIAAGLAEMAVAMHRLAGSLEPVAEGEFSANLSDPRTRVLADALQTARAADLRLAQLEHALRRLNASVQAAQDNVAALQSERERLSMLYQIAQDLNTSLDLDDVLGRVLDQLIEVVHAERGFLMLGDEAGGDLRFVAARGMDGGPLAQGDFGLSRNIVRDVWERQRPLLTTDAQMDERLRQHESVVIQGIRSVMCAPLRVRGGAVGVVYVDSRTERALFDNAHLDLLATFCNQAAIAIDNARLFEDLRRRVREITAMKTYMDNIYASIASGVITADTTGMVTTFNRAAEGIFSLAASGAVGRSYQEVLASIGDPTLAHILFQAINGTAATLGHEVTRTLPQRGEVNLRLNVSPLRAGDGQGEPLGVAMVVDDLTELRWSQRQTEEIQRLFGRYVHPAVVRQLLADSAAINLGGETREITVLFADIRGYTQLAERIAPAELVRILNSYLNILTEAIWCEEGTLTMFIGDALMAIFNAPLAQVDHQARAVRAAWAMRAALQRHHAALPPDAEPVHYGIGVHTGLAVVGNIGSREHLQNYTAIGDAVNVAQRLQAGAADQIILSAATYAAIAPLVAAHALDPLVVKGKTLPLQVYQLDGLKDS
ncbi:MAG TPA: adenylate/guanylate cyclase domain-containing protein [Ktedonobacterales bacterium]